MKMLNLMMKELSSQKMCVNLILPLKMGLILGQKLTIIHLTFILDQLLLQIKDGCIDLFLAKNHKESKYKKILRLEFQKEKNLLICQMLCKLKMTRNLLCNILMLDLSTTLILMLLSKFQTKFKKFKEMYLLIKRNFQLFMKQQIMNIKRQQEVALLKKVL